MVREAAASALGCLSSFYQPGQLALVRSGAVTMLLAALVQGQAPAVVRSAAGLPPLARPRAVPPGASSPHVVPCIHNCLERVMT